MHFLINFILYLYLIFFLLILILFLKWISFSKIKLILNINFWIKFFAGFFIFFVDLLFFIRNFIIYICYYFYHLYKDIESGYMLSAFFTDTDLHEMFSEYKSIDKSYEYVNFEYVYIYLRLVQLIRFSYLICFCFLKIVKFGLRLLFLSSFKNLFVIWLFTYYFHSIFLFLKLNLIEYVFKWNWERLMRIRTHVFLFIYQEYFFALIYRFLNNAYWVSYRMRGYEPYDEPAPTSKFYLFFKHFLPYLFFLKKDENAIIFKNLKFLKIISILIYFFIHIINFIFSGFFFILNCIFKNFFILKMQFNIKIYFYIFLLKYEHIDIYKNLLRYIYMFFTSYKKHNYIFLNFNFNFLKNIYILINYIYMVILGFVLYTFFVINFIIINILIILIKLFPKAIYFLYCLKGFIFILLILYYVDHNFLITIFNYSFYEIYEFYLLKRDFVPLDLINYEVVLFPLKDIFLPADLVFQGTVFDVLENFLLYEVFKIYINYRNEYLRLTSLQFFMRWFAKHITYQTVRYNFTYIFKMYYKLFLHYFKFIFIHFEYKYIWWRFIHCWWYFFTVIVINLIIFPYYWCYFVLAQLIYTPLFIMFEKVFILPCLMLLNLLIYLLFQFWHLIFIKIIYYFYEFFIFYCNWVYFYLSKFIYNIYIFWIPNILYKLQKLNFFLNLIFESVWCQSIKWYIYIIFFDLFNYELYKFFIEDTIFWYEYLRKLQFIRLCFMEYIYYNIIVFYPYLKLNFLNIINEKKQFFFLKDISYSYNYIFKLFFFCWELLDRSYDIISLNYDQFRINYYKRYDIDESVLMHGDTTRKKKKGQGPTIRYLSSRRRNTSIANLGAFDSTFLSSFSFILLDLLSPNYVRLEQFMARKRIYSEWYSKNNMGFIFEYFLISGIICFILCLFSSFKSVFGGFQNININSEYCWQYFRNSDGSQKDMLWLFSDLNKIVEGYFKNKRFEDGSDFRKKLENDPDFLELLDNLKKSRTNKAMHGWTNYEMMNSDISLWRNYWLEDFVQKFQEFEMKNIYDTRFNFSSFYFDIEYENYYENYMKKHAFFHALMLYGCNRNKYLKIAFLNEELTERLPQFHNKFYKKCSNLNNFLRKLLFEIDLRLYSNNLPLWCFHKDIFICTLIDTKEIYKDSKKNADIFAYQDEKFFLAEGPAFFISSFFIYWWMFIPFYLYYKFSILWPRHYLIAKHELQFYFYGYFGRFGIINDFFDIVSSTHWADFKGDRKKASGQSARRRKQKRRYKARWRYFLDTAGWGPFCWWRTRVNKSFFFFKCIYFIYMYLKCIFIYIFLIFFWGFVNYLFFWNKIYKTESLTYWRVNLWKKFWKVKFYVNNINRIKFNYYKKW